MAFRVLGDLVARERRSASPALRAPASGREYDYRRLCTNAWKTGNFLRHLGVRPGRGVAVAADPTPEPVLALFGAALVGGVVHYLPLPDGSGADPGEVRAVVVPVDRLAAVDERPGRERVVYGGPPGEPTVAQFERDVWSENPTEPPDRITPGDPALGAGGHEYDHRRLLEAARAAAERWSLTPGDAVAVRSSLTHPGTVAAGLLAPLLEGGTIVLAGEGTGTRLADVTVADGDPPEPHVLAPGDVLAGDA